MAQAHPRLRYTSLMGLLWRPEGLWASFHRQPDRKAVGVDGIRKADYAIGIGDRLADLSARLRRRGYRPRPARRTYIPKADGGRRPLGIPSFEDRIVQDRLSDILSAIWEPEFGPAASVFDPLVVHIMPCAGLLKWSPSTERNGWWRQTLKDSSIMFAMTI